MPSSAPTQEPVAFATTGRVYYPTICTVFCCLLLLSNIGATKAIVVDVGPFQPDSAFGSLITDGGVFLFPLTYVLGDVLSEVYGLRATRRAILLGFAMSLLAALTFYLVAKSPGIPGNPINDAFAAVLGPIPQILLASMCGYLVGELLNSWVLVKLKERTKERRLWLRLLGSTVVGEFCDTLTFCLIAGPAIGITGVKQLANYTIIGFVLKVGVEALVLPITYRVTAAIKKREPSYQQALAGR